MQLLKDVEGNAIQPLLKHVIPFKFDGGKNLDTQSEEEINSIVRAYGSRDKYMELKMTDSELYTHLLEQIQFNAKAETLNQSQPRTGKEHIIGSHLARKLSQADFKFDPENQAFSKNPILKSTVTKAEVAILDYQLFLFRSGIGFLVLSLNISGIDQVEEFIELNNYLKSISRLNEESGVSVSRSMSRITVLQPEDYRLEAGIPGYQLHSCTVKGGGRQLWLRDDRILTGDSKVICREKSVKKEKKAGNAKAYDGPGIKEAACTTESPNVTGSYEVHEDIMESMLYGEFLKSLLEPVQNINYFSEYKIADDMAPAKALVFSSAVIHKTASDSADTCMKELLRISRGYSQKYDLRVDTVPIYTPFDNVYWAYSREGTGNLIIDEDENKATEFLLSDFAHRLEHSYLVLYILGLHQYYGLIYLSDQASKLPYNVACYSKIDDPDCTGNFNKLKYLREKVYFFHLKCVYEEVSYITHQSGYYRGLLQVLGVKNMIEELDFEMKKVSEIANLVRDEENSRMEKARQEQERLRLEQEKQRLLQETEQKKQEEEREQDKKLLMNMMASGGGLVGLFILYDNIAKIIEYLKLVKNLHFHLWKQEEFNEFTLTIIFILVLLIVGIITFKINKSRRKKS